MSVEVTVLYHYRRPGDAAPTVGVGTADGLVALNELGDWTEALERRDLAALAARSAAGGAVDVPWFDLAPGPELDRPYLLAPLDRQEVWGAGVTYQVSREERMRESATAATVYDLVYDAARPELFFKATPRRVVGPGGAIRVRSDSTWTVPEPELALICSSELRLVGFTIGNDVSARDIEGENPLYLPQAKIYPGSCALGPGMILAGEGFDPLAQTLSGRIYRGGDVLWQDATPVSNLRRTFDELLEWLGRDNEFADGVVLLTGTCLVPPVDVSLEAGDRVELELTGLGRLANVVRD